MQQAKPNSPNMKEDGKREYEISFLLASEESANRVSDILTSHDAEIVRPAKMQNRDLSYPVSKRDRAWFGYLYAMIDSAEIAAITEAFNHEEEVLRFLIVHPPVIMYLDRSTERSAGEGGPQAPRRQERPQSPPRQEDSRSARPKQLTNEDLQEKLEEIMS